MCVDVVLFSLKFLMHDVTLSYASKLLLANSFISSFSIKIILLLRTRNLVQCIVGADIRIYQYRRHRRGSSRWGRRCSGCYAMLPQSCECHFFIFANSSSISFISTTTRCTNFTIARADPQQSPSIHYCIIAYHAVSQRNTQYSQVWFLPPGS